MNTEITKFVHSVDRDTARKPIAAFVTIEHEDCYNKLLDGDSSIHLFGESTKLNESTAPTNIIYENRDTTWKHSLITGFQVFLWITFLLLCSMFLTLQIQIKIKEIITKYEQSSRCDEILPLYEEHALEQTAADAWYNYYANPLTKVKHISAVLNCFCTMEKKTYGGSLSSTMFKDSYNREHLVCKEWGYDKLFVKLAGVCGSLIVVIFNKILRDSSIWQIKRMKLDTRSKEVRAIMVLIFVLIFINTGILVLLSQVSFVEVDGGRTPLSKIFNKPEG
jgi:hypothetical protein